MNDQRSLLDQLIDVYALATEQGLYDAADYIAREIKRVEENEAR
jgi:hypothetical protein